MNNFNAIPLPLHQPRLLVVEDDPALGRAYVRTLEHAGFAVVTEADVPAARARLQAESFDVVITDHTLPSGDGFAVLAAARAVDPALPIVFVTGAGDGVVARRALECGALRYLVKPVSNDRLRGAVEEACRVHAAVSGAHALPTALDGDLRDAAFSERFTAALERIWMARQPVISLPARRMVACEALLRSDDPSLGRPDLLIAAAEKLGRVHELGRRVRTEVAALVVFGPDGLDMLVNLHPEDLTDPDLYAVDAPLTAVASRVILEITERASFERIDELGERLDQLRGLGFRIAIDDLGAGYASLSALAILRPDLVKLDMSLIRDVDTDPVRRRIVEGVGAMCARLGTTWLCEGIETAGELAAVAAAGADQVQGYFLGRPARDLVTPDPGLLASVPYPTPAAQPSQLIEAARIASALCAEASLIAGQLAEIPAARTSAGELLSLLETIRVVVSR
jgi:EAL domain-containing protein (putative c-di-GMP-specific phosphodiesterase class I)/CheY-like chemotaxis protein